MRGPASMSAAVAVSALIVLALATADAVSLSGRKAALPDPHALVELQSNLVMTNLPTSKLKPFITLKKLFGPEEASSACSQPSPTDDFSCAGVTPDVGWPHRNDFPSCHACQGNRGTFLKCCFQTNKAEFLEVAAKLLKYSLFDPAGCRDLPWPSYFMCAFGAVAAKDSSVPKGWIDELDAPAKKNAHLGCQKLVSNAKNFFREEAIKDPKLQAKLRTHVTKMNVLERVCSETQADLEAAMRTQINNGPNLKSSGAVGASKDTSEHAKPRAIPNLLDPSSFPLPFALVHGPDAPPSYYGHHRPAALPVFTSAARRTGNARERPLGTFPVQDFAVGEQQPRCAAVYGHCQHPSVGCSGRYITGRCAGSFGYECCVSYMGMDLLRTQQHMAYLLAHPTGMKAGESSEESSNGAAAPKAAGGKAAADPKAAGAKAPAAAAGESAAPAE